MRNSVVSRCNIVIARFNRILCANLESTKLTVEKLYNVNNNIFGMDVYIRFNEPIFICSMKETPDNPDLVEISVPNDVFLDLELLKDEKIVCDSSILHVVLESILQTQYVTESMYYCLGGNN